MTLSSSLQTERAFNTMVVSMKKGFHLCDEDGIHHVIRVVLVEPRKQPRVAFIRTELHAMQCIVGGAIQAIYPFDDSVALVCNESGKILGLPMNRVLDNYDIIVGTFFLCGIGADDFESLSLAQIERYCNEFYL